MKVLLNNILLHPQIAALSDHHQSKLPQTADRSEFKDTDINIMQRKKSELEVFTRLIKVQGTPRNQRRKDCRRQRERRKPEVYYLLNQLSRVLVGSQRLKQQAWTWTLQELALGRLPLCYGYQLGIFVRLLKVEACFSLNICLLLELFLLCWFI